MKVNGVEYELGPFKPGIDDEPTAVLTRDGEYVGSIAKGTFKRKTVYRWATGQRRGRADHLIDAVHDIVRAREGA